MLYPPHFSSLTFNSTLEELKLKRHNELINMQQTFNSTLEELKLGSISQSESDIDSFNSTLEELKRF